VPGISDRRWIVFILILLAAVVAAAGLILGFTLMKTVGPQVPSGTSAVGTSVTAQTPASATGIPDVTLTAGLPTGTASPPTTTPQPFFEGPFTYGQSFNGYPLQAYRLGTGPSIRAIIGGIHGGYEWNTVELVSKTLEYLQETPTLIPDDVTLYIIPCANPDGYYLSYDLAGRPNGNGVDLNRNWDYEWQPTATHGTRPVNAGTAPFSEPETAALRDLILERHIEIAVFYHSALTKVFYGAETGKSASYDLALVVSEATGYPVAAGVPGQITTGDAVDWMSDQGLAGIEIDLATHEDIEWERNLPGIIAFLNWQPPVSVAPPVETYQIGLSVEGRLIEVTQIGSGDRIALVVIGSIHGDEVNTEALVRWLTMQYADAPGLVPPDYTLYFVPTMNPDGLAANTRYNANGVDLNRNWPTDDWQTDAARTRGIIPGSGGPSAGSEPEVQAVGKWLLETVKPSAEEVWLLSYHSAYPPDGGAQPGYTEYGTPGPQADLLARRVADVSGYMYLPSWPSEYRFTGELIHWCDVNGIWAVEVELPSYDPPEVVPSGGSETMQQTHLRVLTVLLGGIDPAIFVPGDDGYIHYTVQPGDTLSGIAYQFGIDPDEIRRLNGITDEDFIVVGQELLIPAGD